MIRFALIGCGTHAQWAVIPTITALADCCRLVAVADVNPESLDKVQAPGVGKFSDHRRLLAEAEVDAVYVATLPDSHAEIAIDALRAGKHVICEKPLATSVAECEAIAAAARAADRRVAVNFETRYLPGNRAVKQWIEQGRLGRVEAVHVQNFWDGHKTFTPLGPRRKRLTDLSGALDCGVHKADLARYWVGGCWRRVYALGRWFGEDVRFAPHIGVLADLDNGVMVHLAASFAYTAYIPARAYSDVLTIVGNEGVINHFEDRLGEPAYRLHSRGGEETLHAQDLPHSDVMRSLVGDFTAAIAGRRAWPAELASVEDGLQAQRFVEHANRAALDQRMPVTEPSGSTGR